MVCRKAVAFKQYFVVKQIRVYDYTAANQVVKLKLPVCRRLETNYKRVLFFKQS